MKIFIDVVLGVEVGDEAAWKSTRDRVAHDYTTGSFSIAPEPFGPKVSECLGAFVMLLTG